MAIVDHVFLRLRLEHLGLHYLKIDVNLMQRLHLVPVEQCNVPWLSPCLHLALGFLLAPGASARSLHSDFPMI